MGSLLGLLALLCSVVVGGPIVHKNVNSPLVLGFDPEEESQQQSEAISDLNCQWGSLLLPQKEEDKRWR